MKAECVVCEVVNSFLNKIKIEGFKSSGMSKCEDCQTFTDVSKQPNIVILRMKQ